MSALTSILKIKHPIVQAPMLGVTTPAMVAAVSNAAALGSLPLGGLSADQAKKVIRETKALTNQPFTVNLFAHAPAAAINPEEIAQMQAFLQELCLEYGIPYQFQNADDFQFHYYDELIELIIEEKVPVVSFTFGMLNENAMCLLKEKGIVTIGTATSVAEAKYLQQNGVDMVAVQGIEAGGHRGSFLDEKQLPAVGLLSLLPQIAAQLNLPLLAAGGIYDAVTIKAAFALGASAVQVGSLFIPAMESLASPVYKQAVLTATDTSTVLTRAFSGKWARGIENVLIRKMNEKGITIPYYTIQNQLMSKIRAYAQKNSMPDFIAMWAGQSAGKSYEASTREIITRLISQLS